MGPLVLFTQYGGPALDETESGSPCDVGVVCWALVSGPACSVFSLLDNLPRIAHYTSMTADDFAPSEHPAQVAERDGLVHERAQLLRDQLVDISIDAPDDVEAMRRRLEHAGRRMLDAMIEVDAVTAVRNELVVEATESFRLPRSYVAAAAVLTRGRVQQLIGRERDQRSCPRCGADVPEPETARRVGSGDPSAVSWQPWIQASVCGQCNAVVERNQEAGPAHSWRLARR